MRVLFHISIIFIICSCSVDNRRQLGELDEARRLLPDNAAEAFERLNAMDISQFSDSATMARWALLYSEAMAANRLSAPTDTIINIALDYYGRHGDDRGMRRAAELRREARARRREGGTDALATALYVAKEKEFYLFRERARRERYALVGIIAAVMAGGTIVWLRQRLVLERERREALVAEASALRRTLGESHSCLSRAEGELHAMLERRFELIDSLCDTYYESQGTRAERKALAERVKAEIEAMKGDSGMFADMEAAVDRCRGGVMTLLREEYPDMGDEDRRMAVYLACGMSNRMISLLLGRTIEVVYKRKSRIRQRIRARRLPHAEAFEGIFGTGREDGR